MPVRCEVSFRLDVHAGLGFFPCFAKFLGGFVGSNGGTDKQGVSTMPCFSRALPEVERVIGTPHGQHPRHVRFAAAWLCFAVSNDEQPLHGGKFGQMTR